MALQNWPICRRIRCLQQFQRCTDALAWRLRRLESGATWRGSMGLLLAVLIWAIAAFSVIITVASGYHLPEVISEAGAMIDRQFGLTMAVTGVAFILAQGLLGLFIYQYRDRPGRTARYVHGNVPIEAGGAIIVGIVFVTLAIMGQKVWAELHLAPAASGTMPIEITGEQFAWNVRYPGPD